MKSECALERKSSRMQSASIDTQFCERLMTASYARPRPWWSVSVKGVTWIDRGLDRKERCQVKSKCMQRTASLCLRNER